jgi:hypothetical protein
MCLYTATIAGTFYDHLLIGVQPQNFCFGLLHQNGVKFLPLGPIDSGQTEGNSFISIKHPMPWSIEGFTIQWPPLCFQLKKKKMSCVNETDRDSVAGSIMFWSVRVVNIQGPLWSRRSSPFGFHFHNCLLLPCSFNI